MYRILLILAVVIGVMLHSCSNQNLNELKMGEEYIDDESGIALIDTFSLELSTIIIDSIETSGISSIMVGEYNHELFGQVKSEPVFSVGLPDRNNFEEDDVLDSITICLDCSDYYLGDTSNVHIINVMELNTDLDEFDQSAFYNKSRVDTKDESLGQIKYNPRPQRGEYLETRLNDLFGQQLLELFINDADEIQNISSFQDYFRGIVLKGDATNESVLSYAVNDSSLCLKMYYHRDEGEKEELEAVFAMDQTSYWFNQIKRNNIGPLFTPLVEQEEDILSKNTDDVTIIQGSSGLMTKITFPGLADVFQLVKLNQIIKVELQLVPTKEAEDMNDLPSQLFAFTSNKINSLNASLVDVSNNPIPMQLYQANDNYESHAYYAIDITDYIIGNLVTGYFDPDNAIVIGMSSGQLNGTFSTVMLGGELNADYKPKLKIYTYFY